MHRNLLRCVLALTSLLIAANVLAEVSPQVNVYGQVHVSVGYLDNSDEPSFAVSSNSSRLGIKGSQLLENNLEAAFNIEYQIAVSDDAKSLARRNSYGALRGDFGELLIGRYDTPVKKLGRSIDLFWSTQLGENRGATSINKFDSRYDNAIHYAKKYQI